jgi:hypothetical protein
VDAKFRFHFDFSQKDKVLIFLSLTNGYSQKKELAFQPQKINPKAILKYSYLELNQAP